MGYYANGYGCFEVKDTYLIEEKVDEINDEYDAELVLSGFDGKTFILFSTYDKYHEDFVTEVLDALTPLVAEGSMMEFKGEDDALWAFILENGIWVEKNGHVVYE